MGVRPDGLCAPGRHARCATESVRTDSRAPVASRRPPLRSVVMITSTDARPHFRRRFGARVPGPRPFGPCDRSLMPRPLSSRSTTHGPPQRRSARPSAWRGSSQPRSCSSMCAVVPLVGPGRALLPASPRRRDARRASRRGRRPRGRRAGGRARHRRAAGGQPRPARGRVRPPPRRAAGRARFAAPSPRAERLARCHPRARIAQS